LPHPTTISILNYGVPIGEAMSFDIEGILDEEKNKVVQEAMDKFGPSAAPAAEEIASKAEAMIAARMGVSLNQPATSAPQTAGPNAKAEANPAPDAAPEAND
jgi:hypothetical protein